MAFVLDRAEYLPVYVTEALVENLSPGMNTVAEIRDRDLKGKILRVQEVAVDAHTNVIVRVREDTDDLAESNALNLDHTAEFDLHCKRLFKLSLYNNSGALISTFAHRYGYWLIEPSVADKISHDIRLTDEEEEIAGEFGVREGIEKGSLPLPMDTMLKRTFKWKTRRTISAHNDLSPGVTTPAGEAYSSVDTFLILESVALEKPPTGAYTTQLEIVADERSFLTMKSWAASGPMYDIPLFIPAKDSFKLRLTTNLAVTGYDMRYTYSEVQRTPYLEMLYGIVPESEDPELARRIKAGVGPL